MTTFDLTSLISLNNIEKNENKEITIKKFNLNYLDKFRQCFIYYEI